MLTHIDPRRPRVDNRANLFAVSREPAGYFQYRCEDQLILSWRRLPVPAYLLLGTWAQYESCYIGRPEYLFPRINKPENSGHRKPYHDDPDKWGNRRREGHCRCIVHLTGAQLLVQGDGLPSANASGTSSPPAEDRPRSHRRSPALPVIADPATIPALSAMMRRLEPAADVSAAAWITPRLGPFGGGSARCPPTTGHAAHTPVLHPVPDADDALVGPLWIPWAWRWARTVVR